MKKFACLVMGLIILLSFGAVANAETNTGNYRIGIVTESATQSDDDLLGAEMFRDAVGEDRVTLVQLPENFVDAYDQVVQIIVGLADDPLIRAIVVNQAVPGTAEAFQKIHQSRPDVLCLAGEPLESLEDIGEAADLVCALDFVSRGYLIVRTAHELGCDTFVHISFPRHMSGGTASRRAAIMQQACLDLGMRFFQETAPDPLEVGQEQAQAYVRDEVAEWLEDYGGKTAFFCTNDAHTEPLIERLLALGGYFIEADLPSPRLGYLGALGLTLSQEDDSLKTVEAAIVAKGGAGRFGTWAYSFGTTVTAGLAQHAMNVIDGVSTLDSVEDLSSALSIYSPGADWNGAAYCDVQNGVNMNNIILVYQDTYIMGDPGFYTKSTEIEVPDKYALED